jgi:peroxiredoxin Q/BCP
MLQTGNAAPDFTLPRDSADGSGAQPAEVSLSALRPHPVVLYFYPKDDTPGCTKQALAFTEAMPRFQELGAIVLGVSKDPVSKHDRFRAKHDLQITLLSDAESDVCERYGVWVEKNMYGRKFMGIERTTFLIDGEGVIRDIWRKVKVPGHAEAVLEAVAEL